VPEFNCCGYPVRNVDEKAYILPSVRNMALAEKQGLDIFVICNCCFASLQKARNTLERDQQLKQELNTLLAKEDLHYSGKVQIKHFLTILHEEIGVETIKTKLVHKFMDLNVAVIHGCHILRPREITLFDDSFVPKITDELMKVVGISNLEWQGKLECCGAALSGINDEMSHKLLTEKIRSARAAGADYIVPVCSYCYLQFDTTQLTLTADKNNPLPALLYPQLLGLCLGLEEKLVGLQQNSSVNPDNIEQLKSLLGPPVDEKKKKRRKRAKAAA
jgi:heterodisulfide reductase subunit B